MAWLELHQTLRRHPKLLHLTRLLGESDPDYVRAKLENIWLWCLDHAEDGIVQIDNRLPIDVWIWEAAGWKPRGGSTDQGPTSLPIKKAALDQSLGSPFADALLESGWIEKVAAGSWGYKLQIHDWQDYAGRLMEQRRADRERKRAARSGGRPADGGRNRTLPYPTQPGEGSASDTPPNPPPSKGPDWGKLGTPEPEKPTPPESASNQPEPTPGKAVEEADQLNQTVMAFKSFTTPGTKTKRQYLGELRRLGIGHERLRQAAKDNPKADFFKVYQGLVKTVAELPHLPRPAAERPPVLQQPRDKAQQELDLGRIEVDTKISELTPEEVASLNAELEREFLEKKLPELTRKVFFDAGIRRLVKAKYKIGGA